MYRCQKCDKVSKPREQANKVVTVRRLMKYFGADPETGARIVVGEGWETAQEAVMCKECVTPYYTKFNEADKES